MTINIYKKPLMHIYGNLYLNKPVVVGLTTIVFGVLMNMCGLGLETLKLSVFFRGTGILVLLYGTYVCLKGLAAE